MKKEMTEEALRKKEIAHQERYRKACLKSQCVATHRTKFVQMFYLVEPDFVYKGLNVGGWWAIPVFGQFLGDNQSERFNLIHYEDDFFEEYGNRSLLLRFNVDRLRGNGFEYPEEMLEAADEYFK